MLLVSGNLFYHYDLKKVIALSSILHLNFSFISLFSLNGVAIIGSIILSIGHAFSSMGLFLFGGLLATMTGFHRVTALRFTLP